MAKLRFLISSIIMVLIATIPSYFASRPRYLQCPVENCLPPSQCEIFVLQDNEICSKQGTKCCSVVKSEFRTHCRHHGGECMDRCNPSLQRDVVDCPKSVCCVLV